jgi:hypothetical protein
MTADTAATAAQDAPEAAAEAVGTERAAALGMLREAERIATEAERALVLADLREAAAKIAPGLDAAEAATAAAEAALTGPWRELQHLEDDLAEAGRRAANLQAIIDGDDDMGVKAEAWTLLPGFEAVAAGIRERISRHHAEVIAPLQADAARAREAEDLERGLASYVLEAIDDPLGHPLGRSMAGYQLRLARTWGTTVLTGGQDHPDWADALKWLRTALRTSGLGEQVQLAAIAADHAGLVADVGTTKRFSDGTTVVAEPGKPPVVLPGRATPQERRNLRGATVDSTSGADVVAQQWAAAGAQHQRKPGLPGVNHETRPAYPGGR